MDKYWPVDNKACTCFGMWNQKWVWIYDTASKLLLWKPKPWKTRRVEMVSWVNVLAGTKTTTNWCLEMTHPIIFDGYAYIHFCVTGQVDNLATFLEVEKQYTFSSAECKSYRCALDSDAASAQPIDQGRKMSSTNTDWRYRISRWMLRVSSTQDCTKCVFS